MEIVNKTIERRLSKSTTTVDGGCSQTLPSPDTPSKDECLEAFAESIRNFVEKKCSGSVLKLKLSEREHSEEDRAYLETVASNISGISQRQLMVIFFCMLFSRSIATFSKRSLLLKGSFWQFEFL